MKKFFGLLVVLFCLSLDLSAQSSDLSQTNDLKFNPHYRQTISRLLGNALLINLASRQEFKVDTICSDGVTAYWIYSQVVIKDFLLAGVSPGDSTLYQADEKIIKDVQLVLIDMSDIDNYLAFS